MELGKARLAVEVDAAGARSGVNDAVRAFDILKRKGEESAQGILSSFDKLKDKLFSLKSLILGWGLTEMAHSFIEAGKQTEIYTDRLEILLGSVAKGKELFKEMQKFALESPFEFKDVMESATTLSAVVKGGVGEVKEWMPLISDLAAAAGLGIQETTGQVVKMISAGAGAADMFRERGILAMLGFTTGVHYTAQQTRDIMIKSFNDIDSKWRGASKALMSTWEGVTSNLADAWFQFQQRVMVDNGVLNYLKAIVQVLSDDFTGAFGDGTDSAKTFAEFLISGMKQGVLAIGTLLNFIKLLAVAIEGVKASVGGLAVVWAGLKQADSKVISEIADQQRDAAQANYDYLKSISPVPETDAKVADAKEKLREAMQKSIKASEDYSSAIQGTIDAQESNEKSLDNWFKSIENYTETSGPQFEKFLEEVDKKYAEFNQKTATGVSRVGAAKSALDQYTAAGGKNAKQVKSMSDAHERYVSILEKLDKHIMGAQGELDSVTKAWMDYGKQIADISGTWNDYIKHQKEFAALGLSEAQVRERIKQAVEAEGAARDANLAKIAKELDYVGRLNKELDEQISTLGMSARDSFVQDYVTRAKQAYDQLDEAYKKTHALDERGIELLKQKATAFYDNKIAVEQAKQIQEDYARSWESMLNGISDSVTGFLTGQIKSWKDFGQSLVGNVKQFIAQIISEYLKLTFINPILNSMFGSTLNLATSSAMGGGGGLMSMFLGGGGTGAAGGSSGGGGIMNTVQAGQGAYSMGQKIWSGFQDGWTGLKSGYSSFMYGSQYNPSSANFMGPPQAGVVQGGAPSYGGYGSGFGQALGVAGGIYAGYNRYQQGGALGGVAGGAAYGLGTYAVGAGMASAAAGTGFAAGMSGAFAIPVVGWIAAIAMLVDMVSGGKLFGTSANKFQEGKSTLNVGPDGASMELGATFKGQRALFGGSYYKYRSFDVPQEMKDQANDFFKSLKEGIDSFAKEYNVKVGSIVGGSFEQAFDKNGNLTGKTTTTINGKTYKDETQEQFAERLMAENQIAVLKLVGVNITSYTDKFIQDADKYAQAVASTAEAVKAMKSDFGTRNDILGGADKLQDLFDITEELMYSSESLSDAYNRIKVETLGFKDILTSIGVSIDKTGKDFVKFAVDIGEAAGGAQAISALYESFKKYYMTPEEQNRNNVYGLQQYAREQVADLGDAGKGLTFDNFRERFEKALPTLTAEQIKDWLEAGDALGKLGEAIGSTKIATTDLNEALSAYRDVFAEADAEMSDKAKTTTDILNENYSRVLDIANAYDGSADSQDKLLGELQYRYEMELQYLRLIRQIQEDMNASIESRIEDIKVSTMDDKGKYDYFKKKAEDLVDLLPTLTDPQKIAETVKQIQDAENKAWSTLSPEQQKLMADQFIKFLQGVQDVANTQLEGARDNVQSENTTISQAVEDALKKAAEAQQAAADKQNQAANTNLDAANTLSHAEIRVILVDQRSEVGGGGSGRAYVR